MAIKKTTRSADSAAKPAKKAKKITKSASKAAKPKKAAKKATAKKTATSASKYPARNYTLSGVDVTGRNLVIVESPAKGKTIK